MGLFDFFKRRRDDSGPKPAPEGDEECKSGLMGDLAQIHKSPNTDTAQVTEDKDSDDCAVFLSFAPVENAWICPECGTRNGNDWDGCTVCGLKK